MSKAKTIFGVLKHAQEGIEALESAGVDVDRLIGISNAQGPLAKIIRAVLTPDQEAALRMVESAGRFEELPPPRGLPGKSKTRNTRKKKNP